MANVVNIKLGYSTDDVKNDDESVNPWVNGIYGYVSLLYALPNEAIVI